MIMTKIVFAKRKHKHTQTTHLLAL